MTRADHLQVEASVRAWVDRFVVGLDLCPFAGRELSRGRVRFAVSGARTEEALLADLQDEIGRLDDDPDTGTTLLIHPHVLSDFLAYNQFLDAADRLLAALDRSGTYQIASFHPDYVFAGAPDDDPANWTNRSPAPILHLLRESDVAAAVAAHPDPEGIPDRNVARLRALGAHHIRSLLT